MAILTITLTEAVSMGDGSTDRGTTNVHTETVNEVSHRIMDVGTSFIDIVKFASTASAGTFKDASVQYLRITNLDTSGADIILRVSQADAEYFVTIEAEDHFLLGNSLMNALEDGDGSTTIGTTFDTLTAIDKISAKSSSGTIQIELFIACQD
tara:strand:- start:229 stop:687 length:459 start_codon:yes stop_codon:yes gene_type:complete